jgi:hypothetical protein
MAQNNAIETGIETTNDAPATAEWFAYADDGEHATVWAVSRASDTEVDVRYFRCEAGLIDEDGPTKTFDVDEDQTTESFAEDLANTDPEEAVRVARDYWS